MSKLPFESEVLTGMTTEEFTQLQKTAEEIYGVKTKTCFFCNKICEDQEARDCNSCDYQLSHANDGDQQF